MTLTQRALEAEMSLRARARRAKREATLARLSALLAERGELYSVTAADALGLCGVSRCSKAKSLLHTLERRLQAVSEYRRSPTGQGPGRRYYRLAPSSGA